MAPYIVAPTGVHATRTMSRAIVVLMAAALLIPARGAEAAKRTVTVTSEPSGANVEFNGQIVGTTPIVEQFDEAWFKAPKYLWSAFLGSPIHLRIWKEGYVGKELDLTMGPYRWVNANNSAQKIYYVITNDSFRVVLEPDQASRIAHEAAIASATAATAAAAAKTAADEGPIKSTGTGFITSAAGYVVTNHHVIADADHIEVTLASGAKSPATIALQDKINDLVVLKIDDPTALNGLTIPVLRTADPSAVKVGQNAFTLGFPLGDLMGSTARLSTGTISSLYGLRDDPRLLQISNPVQPGNSGGPLFNDRGELVGIVVSGLNAKYFYETEGIIPQNMNFAIKIGFLKNLMEMLPPSPVSSAASEKKAVAPAPLEKEVEVLTPLVVKVTATIPPKKK